MIGVKVIKRVTIHIFKNVKKRSSMLSRDNENINIPNEILEM